MIAPKHKSSAPTACRTGQSRNTAVFVGDQAMAEYEDPLINCGKLCSSQLSEASPDDKEAETGKEHTMQKPVCAERLTIKRVRGSPLLIINQMLNDAKTPRSEKQILMLCRDY